MRVFGTFHEAMSEIQRDLAKGSQIKFTRVQQWENMDLPGRERTGYSYGIRDGFPESPSELTLFGENLGLPFFQDPENTSALHEWLIAEKLQRLNGIQYLADKPTENLHPALKKTLEGNAPSYMYRDRLLGAAQIMGQTLNKDRDSRRAYWPIFDHYDALRAGQPTRVPCSIGYHAMIRNIPGIGERLIFTYLQRSADFDHFFLTDVYLARAFQEEVAAWANVKPGMLIHFIISLHSFDVADQEIY